MSDFDKEAERERLREQYERDQADREVTERMSELLLQGATMTNAHCSECGDPIFRYDGQEFCATCQKPIERAGEDDGDDAGATEDVDADESDAEHIEVTAPSDDARVQFGGDGNGEAAEGDAAATDQPAGTDEDAPDYRTRTVREPQSRAGDDPRAAGQQGEGPRQRPGDAATEGRAPVAPRPAGGGDVDQARGALRRTLTRLSQQAEATEDPREAEAYLSAAREAAETLVALRR